MSTIVTADVPDAVVTQRRDAVVVAMPGGTVVAERAVPKAVVVVRGVAAAPGPPGPAGGTTFERQSAGPLSALRVVWEDEDGTVALLDYRDDDHVDLLCGITVSATSGGAVSVQRAGQLDDASWNWTPGRLWLGIDGAITQTPPADGNDVLIGYAVSPDRIYIELEDPISLED